MQPSSLIGALFAAQAFAVPRVNVQNHYHTTTVMKNPRNSINHHTTTTIHTTHVKNDMHLTQYNSFNRDIATVTITDTSTATVTVTASAELTTAGEFSLDRRAAGGLLQREHERRYSK